MATISFHPATKEQCDAILAKLGNIAGTIGTIHHARLKVVNGTANLYFEDPKDSSIDGVYSAFWAKTVIVKKNGTEPANISDGTVVVENANRGAFATTPFVDTSYQSGDVYRAFCVATNGAINDSRNGIIKQYALYGVMVDEDDSNENTCCHYIEDCAGFDRAYMDFDADTWVWGGWEHAFFHPKPCMLNVDGTVAYYLDPNDYTKRADGTPADISDSENTGKNAMMEWSPVFMKVEASGSSSGGYRVYFSDEKVDEDFECYSGLKADGTYGKWYTAIYEGTATTGNKLRSISTDATPNCQTNATNEEAYARNNGEGYTPMRWADEQLITYLGVLITGRLNFQQSICVAFPTASVRTIKCGCGNAKGPFYGTGDGDVLVGNKMFGMEQKFGHLWNRVCGVNLVENQWYVKMTKHTGDGSTATDFVTEDGATAYTGYIATGLNAPTASNAYVRRVHKSQKTLGLFAGVTGSSSTTYYCDGAYASAGVRGVLLGGALNSGTASGRFACTAADAPSRSNWNYSASLSYRPF